MKGHWFAFIVQIFLAMWFLIVAKVVWTFPIYIAIAYWILLGIIEETVKKKQILLLENIRRSKIRSREE